MKQRLITAAFGLTLLVVGLIFHDSIGFDIAIILINLLAVYESFVNTKKVRSLPVIVSAALYTILIPLSTMGYLPISTPVLHTVYVAVLFLVSILPKKALPLDSLMYAFAVSFLLSQAFTGFIVISHAANGLFLLMYAFSCAWICDAGAYFVGRKLGRHKLAPTISPKKTVEGAIGGLLSSELFGILLALLCPVIFQSVGAVSVLWVAVLTPVLSVAGILGDLMASYIKRSVGIKDFGNLLPGHGGVMDRFDSMLLIVPMISMSIGLIN